MEHKLDA